MSSKTQSIGRMVWIFMKNHKTDKYYVITVDTSRGIGGDFSAFVVIDITEMPFKVVGKYRDNKVSPLLFPDYISKLQE